MEYRKLPGRGGRRHGVGGPSLDILLTHGIRRKLPCIKQCTPLALGQLAFTNRYGVPRVHVLPANQYVPELYPPPRYRAPRQLEGPQRPQHYADCLNYPQPARQRLVSAAAVRTDFHACTLCGPMYIGLSMYGKQDPSNSIPYMLSFSLVFRYTELAYRGSRAALQTYPTHTTTYSATVHIAPTIIF